MGRASELAGALSESLGQWVDKRGPRIVRLDVEVPGLDPAHDGVKIAHVTDLHVGMLTPHRRIRRALELAQADQPDLLFLTGDFVCYSPKFVGTLADILSDVHVPAYAVLGNHDHWTDARGVTAALEGNGIEVLENAHTTVRLRKRPLDIVGIGDAVTGHHDVARAFSGVKKKRSRIVLTHVPSIADDAADYGPGLALAGHTHGGHVHIPKITAHLFKRLGAPYLKGFYDIGDLRLYVNCGVGASSVPIRAGAPSEVAIFTLRSPELS
ncbi:MAG: metallophosphoesterase [Polyangia bacterium]